MMMIPAAYRSRDDMPPELECFYRYSGSVIEPWDGPAAMVFSDGRVVGACLDRNGLRPGRWLVTSEGLVVLGSEAGVLPVDPAKVTRRGRLHPGRLFIVDLERGLLQADGEAELEVARRKPYGSWCTDGEIRLEELAERTPVRTHEPLRTRQLAFGYSQEDLRVLISPTAEAGMEPTGSMGNDLALAALSAQEPSLFSYFKQRFAQVTNPPIDSVRESIVMSLESAHRLRGQHALRGPGARDPARPRPPGAHQRRARARSPAPPTPPCARRRSTPPGRWTRASTGSRPRSIGSPARRAPRSPARRT